MRSTEPRGWSLRTRLVWQLVLAIGLLLGGLFLVLDVLVDRAMYRQLDQFLAARTGALVRQLGAEAHSLDEVLPAWDIAGHTDFFAIYDARGRLQAASMNSGDRPLRAPAGVQGDILLPDGHAGRYRVETLASGGFATAGMVVVPCSMRTLAAVAHGLSDNLVTRAADVTLKERRRLVLMVRETPLNLAHLRNMTAVTEMGGVIFPPLPAFYHHPKTLEEMVDHTVARVLELFDIAVPGPHWDGMQGPAD